MAAVDQRHLCEAHTTAYLADHPPGAGPMAGNAAARIFPGPDGEVALELVRLIISEIHDQQVIMLREVGGGRTFPIVIGIFEATALDRRLKGVPSPRPLTHDAWANTLGALGGRLRDVFLHDLRKHVYYVWLRIQQGEQIVMVDVRPSDGLILAVMLGAPFLIAGRLLDEVCAPAEP